jgi:hemerythrin-like domain-containing protein
MHAQLEEKLFYRACRAIDEAWTNQASEEHELMRRLLRRLEHMPPADDAFRPQAAMLENLVQTHIAKEEEALFPRVREETSDERLLTLGRDLRAMAAHLRTLRDGPARAAEVPDLAHT